MKKADHKFHRTVKQSMDRNAKENDNSNFYFHTPMPVFIPKRKKKK